jgi:predicted GTPase
VALTPANTAHGERRISACAGDHFTGRKVKLHFAFDRFLANPIRVAFGFQGSPIWFNVKPRKE